MAVFESLVVWQRIALMVYALMSLGLSLTLAWVNVEGQAHRWGWADTRWKARLVLETLAIALFCLAFWPMLVLLFLLHEWRPNWLPRYLRSDPDAALVREPPEPAFSVLPEHLGDPVDVENAEAEQRISDPLQAVPDIPFGHLHARWLLLRMHLEPGRTLRRFAVPRRGDIRGTQAIYRGWAVVNAEGAIIAYWVTEWDQQDAATPVTVATPGHGVQP